MSTFYHGTVTAFLPEIKKYGLRPEQKHAWKIRFQHFGQLQAPEDGAIQPTPAVFVTRSRTHAIAYAETRADYFRRNPDSCFQFFEFPKNVKQGNYLFLSKDHNAPVIQTHPELLTLELDSTSYNLQEDPNDPEMGLETIMSIPPSAITRFEQLKDAYLTQEFDQTERQRVRDGAIEAIKKINPLLAYVMKAKGVD